MKKISPNIVLTCIYSILMVAFIKTATGQNVAQVKDQDGNNYKTVRIGNQIWMAENLRTTKYNDGTSIPMVVDKNAWIVLSTPAYCWYNNDTIFKNSYGALYNGFTINTNKLCPSGWHVSTDAEWTALVERLGGENSAGGKLKESGTINWSDPNLGATNESGFSALPGGTRYTNGLFFSNKTAGYWWTTSRSKELNGWYRSLNNSTSAVSKNYHDSTNGFSVRCVRN